MSQINLNTARQVPLAATRPLVPAPIESAAMSLTAKVVSVLALVFFAAFLYIASTRRSMPPPEDKKDIDPTPTRPDPSAAPPAVPAAPPSDQQILKDIQLLADAMLATPYVDDGDTAERERILSGTFSSPAERKEAYVAFVARLRRKYREFPVSPEVEALTEIAFQVILEVEGAERLLMSEQKKEYQAAIEADKARAAEEKIKEEAVRAAEQRKEAMSQSYAPLLRELEEATTALIERSKNLESADRCYQQCQVQKLTFKDKAEFERYESRLPEETRAALAAGEPSDQFKERVEGFAGEYKEEAFQGERTKLGTAHTRYLEVIEEVKGHLKWKELREEILKRL
ncbi:MAG: hypothetical protein H7A38_05210 [Chlamydiales bacterium]|nr:hypothetical protein [Chlamydiales bacterium]